MALVPRHNDVLFGRGSAINNHPGNHRFRLAVQRQGRLFSSMKRGKKRAIAAEIISDIETSGGRFLMERRPDGDGDGGALARSDLTGSRVGNDAVDYIHHTILSKEWQVVDAAKVMTKVMHRLRDTPWTSGDEKANGPPTRAETLEETASAEKTDSTSSQEEAEGKEPSTEFNESEEWEDSFSDKLILPGIEKEPNGSEPDAEVSVDAKEPAASSSNLKNSSGLDDEVVAFLQDFSDHHDHDPIERQLEFTMRQWIETSKKSKSEHVNCEPNTCISTTSNKSHAKWLDCVDSSVMLSIALKLTEFLIEAAKDEEKGGCNPVPLASINAENVLIRLKDTKDEEVAVDHVLIMSLMGEHATAGGKLERLFALGLVLYELLSGGEELPANADGITCGVPLTLNSIRLTDDAQVGEGDRDRPRKKSQRLRDWRSECMSTLRGMNVQYSLCALLGNLLDCGRGDACGDDAYSSFADVRSDLCLMLNEPSRFLDDIETRPMPRLTICDKQYGREDDLLKLAELYRQHVNGNCGGVIITGKAGVGKTKLALHVQHLTSQSGGYFLATKFDQNEVVNPLAAVGSLFDSLCDKLAQHLTAAQRVVVEEALHSALGIHVGVLVSILPNFAKLVPSCAATNRSNNCIDSGMSIRFLFGELLRVVTEAMEPGRISFLLDDLQFADPVSLLLIGSLISSNRANNSAFFTCCYRDDKANENEPFIQLLGSIEVLFSTIKLENLTVDGVNMLVSDTLRMSPRITRPLSLVLHHKAGGGNPLFLHQLMATLEEKVYIYVNLSNPRWDWDMDKIMIMEMSEDVVALFIEEMQRLPTAVGLEVASCIGSCVSRSILDILSQDLGLNLIDMLQQIAQKGFMTNVGDSQLFAFAHDKIQQAAYQLIPEHQRRANHMRYGLAICSHTMDNSPECDPSMFFTAVDQINRGGPGAISNPSQRSMLAALNLKAGKRATDLSDFGSAFKLFKHGIGFLGNNHWYTDYSLTLDLFDAISESASFLNNGAAVTLYTRQLFSHAKCPDDKLNGMQAATKILVNEWFQQDAVESSFKILQALGEKLPMRKGDAKLDADMDAMNDILDRTTNEGIINMEENLIQKRFLTLMKLYGLLGHCFQSFEPSLFGATSLRMVQLTMLHGLCDMSAIAFAFYGEYLVSTGKLAEGIRLGGLSLILVEKKGFLRHKSHVIAVVCQSISWSTTPLQSIVDAHLNGHRAGQLSGDPMCAQMNFAFSLITNYSSGQCLSDARDDSRRFALQLLRDRIVVSFDHISFLHLQSCVLIEGLHMLDEESVNGLPGEKQLLEKTKRDDSLLLNHKVYWLARTFLFREFDDIDMISEMFLDEKIQIFSLILVGIFFEGLISFQLARKIKEDEGPQKWAAKGESVILNMRLWNGYCPWNFENKMLILEAEQKYGLGELEQAERLYKRSIRSANEHKFLHEEALSSELAGDFFYETGHPSKAQSFYFHSIECYKKWGAIAVSRRVESCVRSKYGANLNQLGPIDATLSSVFGTKESFSKKRQNAE